MRSDFWRNGVVLLTALFILAPVGLIFWGSFLTDAFFSARARPTADTYGFVLTDPGFRDALTNTVILSIGMVIIAVPLGSLLAFLMVRTDMPGRRWIEPAIFLPLFMSPMVLAFGYIVSIGPSEFWSVWWQQIFGAPFWNLYSMPMLVLVPYGKFSFRAKGSSDTFRDPSPSALSPCGLPRRFALLPDADGCRMGAGGGARPGGAGRRRDQSRGRRRSRCRSRRLAPGGGPGRDEYARSFRQRPRSRLRRGRQSMPPPSFATSVMRWPIL